MPTSPCGSSATPCEHEAYMSWYKSVLSFQLECRAVMMLEVWWRCASRLRRVCLWCFVFVNTNVVVCYSYGALYCRHLVVRRQWCFVGVLSFAIVDDVVLLTIGRCYCVAIGLLGVLRIYARRISAKFLSPRITQHVFSRCWEAPCFRRCRPPRKWFVAGRLRVAC